jgi:hypothetical protein
MKILVPVFMLGVWGSGMDNALVLIGKGRTAAAIPKLIFSRKLLLELGFSGFKLTFAIASSKRDYLRISYIYFLCSKRDQYTPAFFEIGSKDFPVATTYAILCIFAASCWMRSLP